jgi:AbrB family looped-hinge helix DNA binding protein
MSKVTSKLQVTIPKTIASKFGIRPGDEIDWVVTGEILRVVAVRTKKQPLEVKRKLQRFDEGTLRQRLRESVKRPKRAKDRGWKREDLYERGGTC